MNLPKRWVLRARTHLRDDGGVVYFCAVAPSVHTRLQCNVCEVDLQRRVTLRRQLSDRLQAVSPTLTWLQFSIDCLIGNAGCHPFFTKVSICYPTVMWRWSPNKNYVEAVKPRWNVDGIQEKEKVDKKWSLLPQKGGVLVIICHSARAGDYRRISWPSDVQTLWITASRRGQLWLLGLWSLETPGMFWGESCSPPGHMKEGCESCPRAGLLFRHSVHGN